MVNIDVAAAINIARTDHRSDRQRMPPPYPLFHGRSQATVFWLAENDNTLLKSVLIQVVQASGRNAVSPVALQTAGARWRPQRKA